MTINFIDVPGKASSKEMLGIYRKTLSKVASMKFQNVRIYIEARFETNYLDFNITVYDPTGNNVGFDFYNFERVEKITTNLEKAMNLIRTDDFLKIKAGSKQ